MTNKKVGTLYIGVTSNLARRVWEHKQGIYKGFTQKYKLHILVWYQVFDEITEAIHHEKRMKEWHRQWKIKTIEALNPEWNDLYEQLNA